MVNTVLGSGLLAIPYAFSRTGWVLGLLFLGLAAVLSGVTNYYIYEGAATFAPR